LSQPRLSQHIQADQAENNNANTLLAYSVTFSVENVPEIYGKISDSL